MTITKLEGDLVAVSPEAMQAIADQAGAVERTPIDANDLEKIAKERPDKFLLKGSGVLKLTGAIRQLEREKRELETALAASIVPPVVQAPIEPMVRFCPGCGSIGDVDYTKHRDCCPDGNKARCIPENMALHCKQLFDRCLQAICAEPVAAPIVATTPACETCNDYGMVGGPSFHSPDEGGVPCPDCNTSQPAVATVPSDIAETIKIEARDLHHELVEDFNMDDDAGSNWLARGYITGAIEACVKAAAPSTAAEQASDEFNRGLEAAAVICDQIADEVGGEFDNEAEDCGKAIRLLKSATPADKGNAPAEAIKGEKS